MKNSKRLSAFNLSDMANLDAFVTDNKMQLINEMNGTLKVNLNPGSDFPERIAYIRNRFSPDTVSKDCPYFIYLYLKHEGFDI